MPNAEFLNTIFKKYPFIAANKRKTVNELCYVLRMSDNAIDYSVSIVDNSARATCIPSVRECFVPVRDLARHIKGIKYDGEECGFVCLTVYVED